LDRETVAAALAPIGGCDYYLLVIGSRVGTVIPDQGISVTRAEFRHARTIRRTSGLPNMLHLVRREIAESGRVGKPSSVTEADWPAIQSFISEVKTEERPGDPNWLREFDSMRDVVDVLRSTLNITGPLTKRALEANLLWELRANTRELLTAGKSYVQPYALWYPHDVSIPSDIDAPVSLVESQVFPMFWFRFTLRESALSTPALAEAINGGHFLEYDATSNSFVVGPVQAALLDLRKQIETRDSMIKTISSNQQVAEDTTRLAEATRNRRSCEIHPFTGRFLYAAWTATMNVLRLNRALYRVLMGIDATIQPPELTHQALPAEAAKMKVESVSEQEVDRWLRSPAWQIEPDRRDNAIS
jgi:hypothetical protein